MRPVEIALAFATVSTDPAKTRWRMPFSAVACVATWLESAPSCTESSAAETIEANHRALMVASAFVFESDVVPPVRKPSVVPVVVVVIETFEMIAAWKRIQLPRSPFCFAVSVTTPAADEAETAQYVFALMFVTMFAAIAVGVSLSETPVSTNSSPTKTRNVAAPVAVPAIVRVPEAWAPVLSAAKIQ